MHVGLIGARSFGQHHLQGMQDSPHVQAVTLAGRNREALEALQARFSKVRALTTDYQKLLDDPGIDLVDVVLPHDMHLPVALAALERGKHVLVEKPPARTPGEFQRMIDAAHAADRRLFVVMNLLYSPLHRAVRRAVDAGAIGRPFLALEISTGNALAIYQDPEYWRADRERSGGGLQIDGGFHAVYRQLYFLEGLGSPEWVTADCAQIGVEEPLKGEDFAALTLAYESGARVHLMSQWTARGPLGRFPSGILGTEGSLLFTGEESRPVLLRRPRAEDEPLAIPEGPRGFAETVPLCVAQSLECLATGQAPAADLDLAMLTLECVTGAYRASETGTRQPLGRPFQTRFED